MDVDALLNGKAQHQGAEVTPDGQIRRVRLTRTGGIFSANWQADLVMSGDAFNVSVGGITGGAAESLITGGGNGTTIDTDQPELAVGTPAGFYHIPLRFTFSGRVDLDADGETGSVILFADLDKIIPVPVTASSTIETPLNLLDGFRNAVSYAQSAVTTDITDPAVSVLLGIELIQASEITAAGAHDVHLRLDFEPKYPRLFKGPCSVIAAWGGTAAVAGACSYDFAEVPISRFE